MDRIIKLDFEKGKFTIGGYKFRKSQGLYKHLQSTAGCHFDGAAMVSKIMGVKDDSSYREKVIKVRMSLNYNSGWSPSFINEENFEKYVKCLATLYLTEGKECYPYESSGTIDDYPVF